MSLALYPRWVTLFFLRGVDLPDPARRLTGDGVQVRQIRLTRAEILDEPEVVALVESAKAGKTFAGPARIVVKSISPKQRPRRPRQP